MGYITYFTINLVEGDEQQYEEFLEKLDARTGLSFSHDNTQEGKWYDYGDDMAKLSRKYPALLLQLGGQGEETEDLWRQRFRNGETEIARARFEDFAALATAEERKAALANAAERLKNQLYRLISAVVADAGGSAEADLTIRTFRVADRPVYTETIKKVTKADDGTVNIMIEQRSMHENKQERTITVCPLSSLKLDILSDLADHMTQQKR